MRKPGYPPSMTTPMRLLIVLLVLSTGQAGALPANSNKVAVRLSLAKQRYMVGEQIQVRVEVENQGNEPLYVSNSISEVENRMGYVQFDLTDAKGHRQSPQSRWIGDVFAPSPQEPDWRVLLGSWPLLSPQSSISSQLSLDGAMFPFLTRPGRYKLSGTYSSAGLSYGLNYSRMGLKQEDVASLRFSSWSGKVRSNSVWVTIVPAQAQPK